LPRRSFDKSEGGWEDLRMNMEQPSKTKEQLLEEKIAVVEKRVDLIGEGMDKQIIQTVAMLNLLELPTSGSCEGHLDHGLANPWVDVQATGEVSKKYMHEDEIRQQFAERYNLPISEIGNGTNQEVNNEFWNKLVLDDYTGEYLAWEKTNEPFALRLKELVDEFNQGGNDQERLRLQEFRGVAGRITAGQEEVPDEVEDKGALAKRLIQRQQVMKEFTEFLKKKYLAAQ